MIDRMMKTARLRFVLVLMLVACGGLLSVIGGAIETSIVAQSERKFV